MATAAIERPKVRTSPTAYQALKEHYDQHPEDKLNHPHKWDYFERVERGVYEVRSAYRRARRRCQASQSTVREPRAAYAASPSGPPAETIHAVARRNEAWFVAECLEVAVVTQGRSLDELATNLQEAIDLHLEGENPAALGLVASPRLAITYELPARGS